MCFYYIIEEADGFVNCRQKILFLLLGIDKENEMCYYYDIKIISLSEGTMEREVNERPAHEKNGWLMLQAAKGATTSEKQPHYRLLFRGCRAFCRLQLFHCRLANFPHLLR